jgi:hypothetical protein
VLGEVQPIKTAEKNAKNKKTLIFPYNHQDKYFLIFAPLLFPAYFQKLTIEHAFDRRIYAVFSIIIVRVSFFKFLFMLNCRENLVFGKSENLEQVIL